MDLAPMNTRHTSVRQEIESRLLDREEETIAVCVAYLRAHGHDDAAAALERAFVDSELPTLEGVDHG